MRGRKPVVSLRPGIAWTRLGEQWPPIMACITMMSTPTTTIATTTNATQSSIVCLNKPRSNQVTALTDALRRNTYYNSNSDIYICTIIFIFRQTGRFIAQPDPPWTAADEVYILDVTDDFIPTNDVCSHNVHRTIPLPGCCLIGRLPLARARF